MKTFVLCQIIFLFSFVTYCSDTLLVDTSKVWSVIYGEYPPIGGSRLITHFFKFDGDTIINDTVYLKIFESYDSTNITWSLTGQFIRQDTAEIFLRDYYGRDRILYNFNLNAGDTITQLNMFDQEFEWKINTVDSIFLSNTWQKRLTLGLLDCDGCLPEIWIEGIGSSFGIINPGNTIIDLSTELLCVKKSEEYIYENPNYNSCYIYADITDHSETNRFKIFPNPFNDRIQIVSDLDDYYIEILSTTGQKVYYGNLISDSFINLSDLNNGLYILRIRTLNDIQVFMIIKNNYRQHAV